MAQTNCLSNLVDHQSTFKFKYAAMSSLAVRHLQRTKVLTAISGRAYRLTECASSSHRHVWLGVSESDKRRVIVKSPLRTDDNEQGKAIRQLDHEMMLLTGPLRSTEGVRRLVDQIDLTEELIGVEGLEALPPEPEEPADIWSFGAIIGSLLLEPGAKLFEPMGGLGSIPVGEREREFVRCIWTMIPFHETFLEKAPKHWQDEVSGFTPRLAPTGVPITLSFIVEIFDVPGEAWAFIGDVLRVDPDVRLTAEELLRHPWIKSS